MERFVIILAVLALLTAGCTVRPGAVRPKDGSLAPAGSEPGYTQGFVDGYLSAFPDQPYRRENWSEHPTCPTSAYEHGWQTGHRIGKKDERQRP